MLFVRGKKEQSPQTLVSKTNHLFPYLVEASATCSENPCLTELSELKVYTVSFVSSIAQAFLDLLIRIMWGMCLKLETFCKNLSVHNFVVPTVFQKMDNPHSCRNRLEKNYTEQSKWRWPQPQMAVVLRSNEALESGLAYWGGGTRLS